MDLLGLQQRIEKWENLHTEFKRWPVDADSLAAALVAFTNTDGGQLILGVADDRQIVGVGDPDAVMQKAVSIGSSSWSKRPPAGSRRYTWRATNWSCPCPGSVRAHDHHD